MNEDDPCPLSETGQHDLHYLCGWYCRACFADFDQASDE